MHRFLNDFFHDKSLKSNPVVNWLEVFLLMLALWFIMSGIFDEAKFVLFGTAASLVISLYVTPRLVIGGLKSDSNYFLLHVNIPKFIAYFFWLLKEIVKSALVVTRAIFSGKNGIQPQLVWFKADYDNPAARALLANSITLTPGTVTVDIYADGVYSCHCLTTETRDGLIEGTMQRKVAALYNEEIDFGVVRIEKKPEAGTPEHTRLIDAKYKKRTFRNLNSEGDNVITGRDGRRA